MPANRPEPLASGAGNRLRVGKIVGCHGLRGEVKVRLASGTADWPEALREVLLERPKPEKLKSATPAKTPPAKAASEPQWLAVDSIRIQMNVVLVRFAGYPDRTAAETLVGSVLYADSSLLTPPDEGEYWVDDLIGLSVLDARTGKKYGVVKDLLSSTGSDFLEIRLDAEKDTVVIPFLDHFFPSVDLNAGTLLVDLPAGFLPDDAPDSSV